ncbi:DSBA-like thioredoxin domain-containing protein [Cynara cardunculus var. scolymus]|uniref:DSBA-like thioredoxin domain-containing protein n=1 Tax=Cynara cardunculus var. scolymus TaxID=59895 RepID=A0A124SHA8_CYNCS|nr:DSBA-like thioredoxin domain-containing protein [Cynara cardunculus var. scolymus]
METQMADSYLASVDVFIPTTEPVPCSSSIQQLSSPEVSRYTKLMAQSASNAGKKLIKIDVTSDSVCPWCFVGKKNLDKAVALSKDQYNFEIKWHPFLLNPSAPKEGINKKDYYRSKFGSRADQMHARMSEVFKGHGLEYDLSGLTGSSLDSHRLILFAGKQGSDKQHTLVEELFNGYFTQGKFIGDRAILGNYLLQLSVELQANSMGVLSQINGMHQLSGGQPAEVFLRAFQVVAN